MNERQRRELLDEIRRSSATVGKEIPDRIDVQGTTIDVKQFVFDCDRLEAIPEAERDRIEELQTRLRRERLERKRRIERGEVTYEEGKRLVEGVHGIDRALNALEGLDTPDVGEQLRQKELEDARELLALVERRP